MARCDVKRGQRKLFSVRQSRWDDFARTRTVFAIFVEVRFVIFKYFVFQKMIEWMRLQTHFDEVEVDTLES